MKFFISVEIETRRLVSAIATLPLIDKPPPRQGDKPTSNSVIRFPLVLQTSTHSIMFHCFQLITVRWWIDPTFSFPSSGGVLLLSADGSL